LSKKAVKPGETLSVEISVNGGTPPYRLSGDTTGDLYEPETIQFAGPRAPGSYSIRISAIGAKGRVGSARVNYEVVDKFTVSLFTSKKTLKPGESLTVNVNISGGKSPFQCKGVVSGPLNRRDKSLTFIAPNEPGSYSLKVSVRDANKRVTSHNVKIQVVAEPEAKEVAAVPKSSLPMEPAFDLSGISVTVIHTRGRAADANRIVDFLRRSGATAIPKLTQNKKGMANKHKGVIYASRVFAGKANLIARQVKSIEPLKVKIFTKLKKKANHLVLWLL